MGWQGVAGLIAGGYTPYGPGLPHTDRDVQAVCLREKPDIVFVEMKHVWDTSSRGPWRETVPKRSELTGVDWLGRDRGIYRVTRWCDPRTFQGYMQHFLTHELRPHAILVRYDLDNVAGANPWLDRDTLVRNYHTIDKGHLSQVTPRRQQGILSGAMAPADVYPLRSRLAAARQSCGPLLRAMELLSHCGYAHKGGPEAQKYLAQLAQYRVAVVTTPYGWAIKKLWEATLAGCIVLTNLPADDVIPGIDENLIRIPNDIEPAELARRIRKAAAGWNRDRQQFLAEECARLYDYRVEGARVAAEIRGRCVDRRADAGDDQVDLAREIRRLRQAIETLTARLGSREPVAGGWGEEEEALPRRLGRGARV